MDLAKSIQEVLAHSSQQAIRWNKEAFRLLNKVKSTQKGLFTQVQ